MNLRTAILVLAVILVGCDDPPSRPANDRSPPAADPTPAPTPVDEEPPADVRDVAGLEVTLGEDGRIQLRGSDRWGGSLDGVYSDHTYFRNAVPVLERGITPEQAAGLRALAAELAAAAPSPDGEADSPDEADTADPAAD